MRNYQKIGPTSSPVNLMTSLCFYFTMRKSHAESCWSWTGVFHLIPQGHVQLCVRTVREPQCSLSVRALAASGFYFTSEAAGFHTYVCHLSRSFLLSWLTPAGSHLEDMPPGKRDVSCEKQKGFLFPRVSASVQADCQKLIAFKQ